MPQVNNDRQSLAQGSPGFYTEQNSPRTSPPAVTTGDSLLPQFKTRSVRLIMFISGLLYIAIVAGFEAIMANAEKSDNPMSKAFPLIYGGIGYCLGNQLRKVIDQRAVRNHQQQNLLNTVERGPDVQLTPLITTEETDLPPRYETIVHDSDIQLTAPGTTEEADPPPNYDAVVNNHQEHTV